MKQTEGNKRRFGSSFTISTRKGLMPLSASGVGLRPWLLGGLAAFVVVLVLSVGFVALWAFERRAQSIEIQRMAVTADSMAALLSAKIVGRGLDGSRRAGKGRFFLTDLREVVQGFVSMPGVIEVGLIAGQQSLVIGKADIVALGRDGRGIPLRTGLVDRRDEEQDGLLLFYRRISRTRGADAVVLRLVVDRDKLLGRLFSDARMAFWGLAAFEAVMVVILAGMVLTRTVTGPLSRLENAARAVAQGDLDGTIEPEGRGEIRRLFDAFAVMTEHLRQNRGVMEDQIMRLAEQARTLERKQRELDETWQHVIRAEKFASVGRLAAGIAHEVGNPLTALLGYVEMMKDSETDPDAAMEFLDRMDAELRRVDGIIRGLLDYSRRSEGGVEQVAVGVALDRATELLSAQKRFRWVEVDARVPEGLSVLGSQNRVVQVLLNLFVNAADAMEGRGRIFVRCAGPDSGMVEVWVCDEGPGVAEEHRETIFDPFFTTKDVGDGTGLGLAVSRSLMEAMNGRLELSDCAKSPLEVEVSGACFRLVFEASNPTDQPPEG